MEVMSQDEINKLLAAIAAGGDSEDEPSQEEKKGRQPLHTSTRKIYNYDFRRPIVFIKEVQRNFSYLFDELCRVNSVELKKIFTREDVEVWHSSIDEYMLDLFIYQAESGNDYFSMQAVINGIEGNILIEIPANTGKLVSDITGKKITANEDFLKLITKNFAAAAKNKNIEAEIKGLSPVENPLTANICPNDSIGLVAELFLGTRGRDKDESFENKQICFFLPKQFKDIIKIESEGETQMGLNIDSKDEGGLDNIKIPLNVVIGSTEKTLKEISACEDGTIIELNTLAGEPAKVYANNQLIAMGEIVVIDENLGVRLTEVFK